MAVGEWGQKLQSPQNLQSGLCEGICSEVFNTSSGFAVAGEVSKENEDSVREACDSCPVSAISIGE